MEFNNIPIKIQKTFDFEYTDSIDIIFINKLDNSEIGYITYKEKNFIDSYMEDYEPIEIQNIVEEYEPMSIEYIEVKNKYKQQGFGTFIMKYFVKNILKQNICILLRSAFGISDLELRKYMNDYLLIKFYEKFGFVKIPNTQYMIANLY